jgi:Cu-processing system permease protein
MIGRLLLLARLELSITTRRRWVRLFSAAFALMSAGVAWSAGGLQEVGAAEAFGRTTVALVPLVLMVAPLAALLVGVTGQSGEPGGEAFLFALPLRRSEVLLGRWLGQAAALGASLLIGFAAGGAIVADVTGDMRGLLAFSLFVLAAALLTAAFLSLAALVAVCCPQRTAALGVACFLWFFLVIFHDAAALWAAGWLSGRMGANVLFTAVILNPVDTARVAILSLAGTPHVLGPAGEAWRRALGGEVAAALLALAVLLAWTVLPLEAARRVQARKDLLA